MSAFLFLHHVRLFVQPTLYFSWLLHLSAILHDQFSTLLFRTDRAVCGTLLSGLCGPFQRPRCAYTSLCRKGEETGPPLTLFGLPARRQARTDTSTSSLLTIFFSEMTKSHALDIDTYFPGRLPGGALLSCSTRSLQFHLDAQVVWGNGPCMTGIEHTRVA